MIRQIAISAVSALVLLTGAVRAQEADVKDVAFSFEGPFGTFDEHQLQRGLQVYTEVCAACHGLKFVRIGALADVGGPHLPEDQVKAYAAAFPLNDEDSNRQLYDTEKGKFRPLTPADNFPANYSFEKPLGAPDLSVMAKARAGFHGPMGLGITQLFYGMGGPEYIVSILTGFKDAPDCTPKDFPGAYNANFERGGFPDECKIFKDVTHKKTNADGTETDVTDKVEVGRKVPGSWIRMPAPLSAGQVKYADGTEASLQNESEDVAAFLMWAAEPKMMVRKESGFKAVFLLALLSVLLYVTNKRLWANVKGKKKTA